MVSSRPTSRLQVLCRQLCGAEEAGGEVIIVGGTVLDCQVSRWRCMRIQNT